MRVENAIASAMCLALTAAVTTAQWSTTTMRLKRDQIAIVKTAMGITTRLAFTEQVQDIICGDLYDPATGRGGFVVQRVDNDVFIKPVVSKGLSNLFVKVGRNRELTYSFDLLIGSQAEASRIVNVVNAEAGSPTEKRQDPAASAESPINNFGNSALSPEGQPDSSGAPRQTKLPASASSAANNAAPRSESPRSSAGSEAPIWRDAIKRVAADYVQAARQVKAQGEVVVEVTIDENGKVTSAQALSGPQVLRSAAVKAAGLWEFSRVNSNNYPRQDVAKITFTFQGADGKVESFWSSLERAAAGQ